MFQFTAFASFSYVFTKRWPEGRVSPFRHLWIKGHLPPPQSFSQAITSFVACNRQGIHHMHLFTWPYNCIDWQYRHNSTKCECCFYMSTTLGLFAVISSFSRILHTTCFLRTTILMQSNPYSQTLACSVYLLNLLHIINLIYSFDWVQKLTIISGF
jgi:hypothetical protein